MVCYPIPSSSLLAPRGAGAKRRTVAEEGGRWVGVEQMNSVVEEGRVNLEVEGEQRNQEEVVEEMVVCHLPPQEGEALKCRHVGVHWLTWPSLTNKMKGLSSLLLYYLDIISKDRT